MSRIYKQKKIERIQEILVKVICDKCGEEVREALGIYDTRDFDLEFSKGSSYGGDGGNKEGWEVEDLCDPCVADLKNLLEANGYRVAKIEVSW